MLEVKNASMNGITLKTMTASQLEFRIPVEFDWLRFRSQLEKSVLSWAIRQAHGNINVAAGMLGLNRTTMYERCKAHELVDAIKEARKEQVKMKHAAQERLRTLSEPYDCGAGL